MSGATHSHVPVRRTLFGDQRRVKIIALALVATLAALLVALVFALSSDESQTAPSAALTQRSAPATFDPDSIKAPGQRSDGGPEESSVAAALGQSAPSSTGPDESTTAAAISGH